MTILNVTKKYELGKDKSYRCVANAVNISKPAQFVFHIYVIQGMFFNKHLDKVIFKFKWKSYIIVIVSITPARIAPDKDIWLRMQDIYSSNKLMRHRG